MGARRVGAAQPSIQGAGGSSGPAVALHTLRVAPAPAHTVKSLLECHRYLHSLTGGAKPAFGVFLINRLVGCVTLGVGPKLAYHLVDGADHDDCRMLTLLWAGA